MLEQAEYNVKKEEHFGRKESKECIVCRKKIVKTETCILLSTDASG
jgi:hypothetical protein